MNLDNLKDASGDKLKRIVAEAEAHLVAQLQSGIAADQRAMQFISLMAAASVVTAGGAATLILGDNPNIVEIMVGWIAIVIAFGFLISMNHAVASACPTDFHFSGSWPSDWAEDVNAGTEYEQSLREQAVNFDERIRCNYECLSRNKGRMDTAVNIALLTLFSGGSAGVVLLAYFTYRLLR